MQQSSWEAVIQLVMKFSVYYETLMFLTFFTDSNPDKLNSQNDTLFPKNWSNNIKQPLPFRLLFKYFVSI